ncbi:MAG: hypothetical protein AAGD01_11020 [Acidobacteriota bacterium]
MRIRTLLFAFAIAFITFGLLAAPAAAQNQAGVVVDYGNGNVQHVCVNFSTPTINGLQLLDDAGFDLDVQSESNGDAVCSIDGTGCDYPNQNCFCSCSGSGTCVYWGYWILDDNDWDYSSNAVNKQIVGNGGVNGWSWSDGDEPPLLTFEQICGDD